MLWSRGGVQSARREDLNSNQSERSMAYRNILVHVDILKAAAGRLDVAVAVAQDHEAHLTGLSLTATSYMPTYVAAGLPSDLLQIQRKMALERAEKALAAFEKAAKLATITTESRIEHCIEHEAAAVVNLHARYADLLIIGQVDPDEPPSGGESFVEDVVLGAGRPVLVVPYIGAPKASGKRVIVAWDASREAARAVTDAMPFLTRAEKVTVLVVNPERGPEGHGEQPGADVAVLLARHGVNTEVHQSESPDISVGDEILSRVADDGSDLLVMGAYGHTRLRELVLGGATRSILEEMTVPVLMSH